MILEMAQKKVWQVRNIKVRAGGHSLHVYTQVFYKRVFAEKTKP